MSLRVEERFTWLLFVVFTLTAWSILGHDALKMDEVVHVRQGIALAEGNLARDPDLTTFRGFHWVMAGVYALTESVAAMRLANLIIGLLAIVVFAQCWRIVQPDAGSERVLQYALLPILLPYSMLVYTDTLSLLLIMGGFLLCLRRHYLWGIVVLTASLGVRQNNVIWLMAAPAFAWIFHNPQLWREGLALQPSHLRDFVARVWPVIFGALGFAVFVIVNGGVAVGAHLAHPPFALHAGNVFFFLLVYFLVFLPVVLWRTRENLRFAVRHRAVAVAVALTLLAYMAVYESTHPYNTIFFPGDYFLRNWLLLTIHENIWTKLLFFVPVALALLDLMRAAAKQPIVLAILLATAAFVLPAWLIEQRYYLPTFFFLLLFLPLAKEAAERLTVFQAAVASALVIYGIHTRMFYL